MRILAVVVVLAACTEHGMMPTGDDDTTPPPGLPPMMVGCPAGHLDKIKFEQSSSCSNDGSVEFCIPDNDAARAMVATISPDPRCAPGGGRANCAIKPGLLLCTYATAFPEQCSTSHGAMTPDTWSDICEIAAMPEVFEIVSTFFE